MRARYDLAVVGSGFAGSLLATIAKKLGHSVILLERGRHPRFAIGESSTPLANLLLEELAARYDLPNIAPLAKWGTWQAAYPHIGCGLKRGFSFFHHSMGQRMATNIHHDNQLLVAASPHDRIADVHWYRADVDEFLVKEAEKEGVDFVDEVKLDKVLETVEGLELQGSHKGTPVAVRASFVVDASGPRGFLHKALSLSETDLPFFPGTQSLYTHFRGVRPFADCSSHNFQEAPFPIDDAAIHHTFPGGWIWVLRFNNGVTSAGVAAVDSVAKRYRFEEGAPAWERLLRDLPSVQDQFADAQRQRPFTYIPKLAFRSGTVAGRNWALLPSAAGFVDPLLSTGFPLTLLGITRLARMLQEPMSSPEFGALLEGYSEQTGAELLATSRLIASLYKSMDSFPSFSSLLLHYFAAASYSETARRLGKPDLAGCFLMDDHPEFGPQSRCLLDGWLSSNHGLTCGQIREAVLQTIEPINVAGLGLEARKNWYPVVAEDLLAAAGKLHSSRDEIRSLLNRSGFWDERV